MSTIISRGSLASLLAFRCWHSPWHFGGRFRANWAATVSSLSRSDWWESSVGCACLRDGACGDRQSRGLQSHDMSSGWAPLVPLIDHSRRSSPFPGVGSSKPSQSLGDQ